MINYTIFNVDSLYYGMLFRKRQDSIESLEIEDDYLYNFRPNLALKSKKMLFLTDKYSYILNKYLLAAIRSDTIKFINSEGIGRESFLENKIKIFLYHSSSNFHLETFPIINRVLFNKNKTVSFVDFQILHQGGVAIYKKENNKWIFIESYSTWIE